MPRMPNKSDFEAAPTASDFTAPEAPTSTAKSAAKLAPERLTPQQWAEKLGNVVKGSPHVPHAKTFPSAAHAVADKLHGWSQHAQHFQGPADGKRNVGPLMITREDYEAALDVASNQVTKVPVPHEAALSPVSHIAKARATTQKAAEAAQESR